MSSSGENLNSGERTFSSQWASLRSFDGPPNAFWPQFLAAGGELTGAIRGLLLRKSGESNAEWRKLGEWTSSQRPEQAQMVFTQEWLELIEECRQKGGAVRTMGRASRIATSQHGVAARVQLPEKDESCVSAFLLPETTPAQAEEALRRLMLVSDVPLSYTATRNALRSKEEVEKFATVLDILAEFNSEKRFLAAALALCNATATRFKCDRVSLGWLKNGFVRLQAISRTERFDRKMAAVSALESAMEECIDQDDEISHPAPEASSFISRDHEKFCQEQKVAHIASIPLRVDDKPVAVLTCERQAAAFTQIELQQLRLLADQAIRRLNDLKKSDRWFGARWLESAREMAGKVVGAEHTWVKIITATVTAVLLVLIFLKVPYRVEAKCILRSDRTTFLSAPFKGFIYQALARPGDLVSNSQPLLKLNTDELLLEETASLAEISRYHRESERARASNALAEMQVALSQLDQAKARLELVRYRIDQAAVKVPFDGVVTEGDLRERIGAPVDQGETLMKVAEISSLYIEAEVPERDIHNIKEGMTGEIAFVSRPDLKYPVKLLKLEPAAVPKEGANVFLVRCQLQDKPSEWWRPGMSGICKLDVGKASLLWIGTHRTVDFLRLWLWW